MQSANARRIVSDFFSDPLLGARTRTVEDGNAIFEPTDTPGSVFFIEAGQVRKFQVNSDSARLTEILGPGEWFGKAALAHKPSHGYRAVAVDRTILKEASVERLEAHLRQRPEVAVELVLEMAQKLCNAEHRAASLVFDDCHSRLLKALIELSESAAAERDGEQIVLRITHQQLAQSVGAARETISLALTELRKKHLLRTGRNRLSYNLRALRETEAKYSVITH